MIATSPAVLPFEWTSKDMGKVHTCDECYRKFLERVKEAKG